MENYQYEVQSFDALGWSTIERFKTFQEADALAVDLSATPGVKIVRILFAQNGMLWKVPPRTKHYFYEVVG